MNTHNVCISLKSKSSKKTNWLKIDSSIFQSKRSPFEALVVYFKDKQGMSYHDIGVLLNRDERNIWTVYNRGKKKK